MRSFHKIVNRKIVIALLVIGLLPRLIVAAGYMLNTSPEDGGPFSVKLCNKSAGFSAIIGMDEQQHHDNKHEHKTQDGTSPCNFWLSSSQVVLADDIDIIALIASGRNKITFSKRLQSFPHIHYLHARAPPTPV